MYSCTGIKYNGTGAKSGDFAAKGIAADCARPSDTLAAEKYFSDTHVVRKMISLFRGLRAANSARLFDKLSGRQL